MDFSGYNLILTPNHRLTTALGAQIPVYSLSQWVEKQFLEHSAGQTLLNPPQQLLLIKQLIGQTNPELLGLAPLVQSAWHQCHQYQFEIHSSDFSKNEDTEFFQQIAVQLQEFYKKNNLTDLDLFMANITIPDKTVLVGFDQFSPLEKKLLGHCPEITPQRTTQKISKTSFENPEAELKNMVLWACSQPYSTQIGCIIPDLESHRDKLDYYFEQILSDKNRVTFSAIKKLSDYYFIQDSLAAIHPLEKTQKASAWAEYFEKQFKRFLYHHSGKLNSEEYLLTEKYKAVLGQYKNHDLIIQNLNFNDALQELKDVCSRTIFQPPIPKAANIFILSLLESSGLLFDKLWVAGMDTRHFPYKSRFNPFLPFKHVITKNYDFKNRASEIIYSYPENIRDEKIIPHKLLNPLSKIDINLPWPVPAVGNKTIQTVPEHIPVDTAQLKHHGSQIFKDHIACPFRAFAKHRLNAKKPDLVQLGFSALQRGNIIHEILDNLWKALENKQNLVNYPQDKLAELINSLINTSLNKYAKNTRDIFITAEKSRLEKLMHDWLELEKNREDFVVIATEKTIETHIGKLPLKLRIDRIDQIGENQYLIIDYKTSQYDITGDLLDEPQLPLYTVVSAINVHSIAFGYLRSGDTKLKQIPTDKIKIHWEEELVKIADDFLCGNITVKPKYGEETCRLCDLKSLCRINSFPNERVL